MGSRHRALLALTGGGERLHEAERNQYRKDLNDFLRSYAGDNERAAALAHFDMGYDDGHSGQEPYYNEDWDEPMGRGE